MKSSASVSSLESEEIAPSGSGSAVKTADQQQGTITVLNASIESQPPSQQQDNPSMNPSSQQLVTCRSRAQIRCLLIVLLLSAGLHPAAAQRVYQTGFEKQKIATGPLAGQDGWIAPPPLSPNAAVVTTDKPRIGRQTVQVAGTDLVPQDFINTATEGYYDAIGSYRRSVDFDAAGAKVVLVSAYVRVDGAQTALGNNFFSASVAARATLENGDTAGVGELAISSDGHAYGNSGNETVPTFQTSTQVELGKWHNLTVSIDFGTQKYSFFVDNRFQGQFASDTNNVDENGAHVDYTGVLARGSLIAYVEPDAGDLAKADYTAAFDQFSIKAKPGRQKTLAARKN